VLIRRLIYATTSLSALTVLTSQGMFDSAERSWSYGGAWVAFAAGFALTGFVVGRWWALVLAPYGFLMFVILGAEDEALGYAFVLGIPSATAGLAVGLIARVVGNGRGRRARDRARNGNSAKLGRRRQRARDLASKRGPVEESAQTPKNGIDNGCLPAKLFDR
jgi:hypothetical protein